MTALGYKPLGAGAEFTTALLDENFLAIAEYTQKTERYISALASQIDILSKRPTEVIVKLPKSRKMLYFTAGVTIGVYVYKRRRKIEVFFDTLSEGAKKRSAEPVVDGGAIG